jgi:hypothetical protein
MTFTIQALKKSWKVASLAGIIFGKRGEKMGMKDITYKFDTHGEQTELYWDAGASWDATKYAEDYKGQFFGQVSRNQESIPQWGYDANDISNNFISINRQS